jgi:hypothetical protein
MGFIPDSYGWDLRSVGWRGPNKCPRATTRMAMPMARINKMAKGINSLIIDIHLQQDVT